MSEPELKLLVEEHRRGIDVFTMWLPRIGVVLAFLFIGLTKFNSDPRGEWFRIFQRIGFGQWFRYFTGGVQVLGALLLLSRRTLTLGAAMLAGTMIGAVFVDIVVMRAVGFALLPLVLLGMVLAVWFSGCFGSAAYAARSAMPVTPREEP